MPAQTVFRTFSVGHGGDQDNCQSTCSHCPGSRFLGTDILVDLQKTAGIPCNPVQTFIIGFLLCDPRRLVRLTWWTKHFNRPAGFINSDSSRIAGWRDPSCPHFVETIGSLSHERLDTVADLLERV